MFLLKKIRQSLSNCNIDFMSIHKLTLSLSIICIIASLFLVFTKGLNLGIDFAGGILVEAKINNDNLSDPTLEFSKIREILSKEIKDINFQESENKYILIRVAKTQEDSKIIIQKIQDILQKNFSKIEYRKIEFVGPQIGTEMIFKSFLALLFSFIFILIYIWIRFDWQFGIGGIFALIHDAILTLGFFAITNLEFSLTSIASILTIIGYSINDSVVIYDRIRENLKSNPKINLITLINSSTNSTLSRTILTSSTTLISLFALILFGGDILFSFSMATFFGIVIGTYSSIYISAPILLYFDPRKEVSQKK